MIRPNFGTKIMVNQLPMNGTSVLDFDIMNMVGYLNTNCLLYENHFLSLDLINGSLTTVRVTT